MNEIASTNLESIGKRKVAAPGKKAARKRTTGRAKSIRRKVAPNGKA